MALIGCFSEIQSNTIAFLASTLFAYFGNTIFVFQKKLSWKNFGLFWGLRIGTIFLDNGGIYILLLMTNNPMFSKLTINGILVLLNYLFSKLIIYQNAR